MTSLKSVFATVAMTTSLALSSQVPPQVPVIVEQPVVVQKASLKETLIKLPLPERQKLFREKVIEITKEKGVPQYAEQIYTTIAKCENIELDPNKQSGNRYKVDHPEWNAKAGDQEKSFGLIMIHLPSHPEFTKEQAQDAEHALRWMVDEFKAGRQTQWTCWRSFYQV